MCVVHVCVAIWSFSQVSDIIARVINISKALVFKVGVICSKVCLSQAEHYASKSNRHEHPIHQVHLH